MKKKKLTSYSRIYDIWVNYERDSTAQFFFFSTYALIIKEILQHASSLYYISVVTDPPKIFLLCAIYCFHIEGHAATDGFVVGIRYCLCSSFRLKTPSTWASKLMSDRPSTSRRGRSATPKAISCSMVAADATRFDRSTVAARAKSRDEPRKKTSEGSRTTPPPP